VASWCDPPARVYKKRNSRDAILVVVCLAACAAIILLTPTPDFGPAQSPRAGAPAAGLTAARPEPRPSTMAAPAGHRRVAVSIAILTALGLAFSLVGGDLLRVTRGREDTFPAKGSGR
jgi:hypothetical protein